jgi:hypothetical protein
VINPLQGLPQAPCGQEVLRKRCRNQRHTGPC